MSRRPLLPYEMFDVERSADEAKRFDRMANIYHRGQALAWDGRKLFDELVEKHGGVKIAPHQVEAVRAVYGPILWGELAAWKIAAQLADRIEPLEAKMAATSQAHDEARHFYVMHDWLKLGIGDIPRSINRPTEQMLGAVLNTPNLAKKVVGMQLQIETTALTIFQASREAGFCPVLKELLIYFEKDEARHVGLGTQYLPTLLKDMNLAERLDFMGFQIKVILWSMGGLRAMEPHLRTLGIDPRRILMLAKSKQEMVYNELWDLAPGTKSKFGEAISHVIEATAEAFWPNEKTPRTVRGRVQSVWNTLLHGLPSVPTHIEPPN